jgi:uncharacterized protein YecT (DUF1311 family)
VNGHRKDRGFLAQFDAAQNAWHEFREAEIRSIYAHADDSAVRFSYGTVYPMCVAGIRASMTTQRIRDMQQWLVGTVADIVCNGELPEAEGQR